MRTARLGGPLCRGGALQRGVSGRSPHGVWAASAAAAPPLLRCVWEREVGGWVGGGKGVKDGQSYRGLQRRGRWSRASPGAN